MSLLRRIEGRPQPEQPQQPGQPGGQQPPRPPAEGPLSQTAAPGRDSQRDARVKLQTKIINNLDPRLDLSDAKAVRSSIEEMFNKYIDEEGIVVTRVERQRMLEQILDEILGFGPIQPLLNDDTITEVMVNGPFRTYVERKGKLQLSDVTFVNDEHVMRVIERIIAPIGRRVDEAKPYEDARLPDGSRVNIIIPPLALNGPVVTIRKFPKYRITVEDYIVVGETRGGEALSMLQAMNAGHDGSLSTGHANSPRDILARLETMCLMAGVELPARAIREQIASALDLIIQISRLKDGSRKITNITEVQGMEGETIVLQDVFVFEQTGYVDGKVQGRLRPTGIRPKFSEKFEAAGIKLPQNTFGDMSAALR